MNIYDLSKKSGYSISTVSKALNGYPDISEKTRQKILDMARDMGFSPNAVARNLSTKRSQNIGIQLYDEVVDNVKLGLSNSFFASIINAFREYVEDASYDVLFLSDKFDQFNKNYVSHCRTRRLDGVFILCGDYHSPQIMDLLGYEKSVVALDYIDKRISSVTSTNRLGMQDITQRVLGLGYKSIVFCSGGSSLVSVERLAGFMQAVNSAGFTSFEVREMPFSSIEQAYKLTCEVIDRKAERPCIFFTDDYAAIGGIRAVQDRGVSMPSDIGLVGFDGIKLTQLIKPRLATVQQNSALLGRSAGQLLLRQIEDKNVENECIEVATSFLSGDTIGNL